VPQSHILKRPRAHKFLIIKSQNNFRGREGILGFDKPSRELYLGEILSQTFNLYSSRFFLFYIPFLVAGFFTGAWGEIVSRMFPMPAAPELTAPPDVLLSYLFSLFAVLVVTFFLVGLVSWIIGTIVNGMVVKVASDVLERRSSDLSEAFDFTVGRLPSLLGAGIVTGILIVVGLICLVVPGIILAIMFSLVVPAIVIERVGALESLSRSRRLVGGRWLKTFGLLLLIYIIIFVAGLIFGAISSVFVPVDWIVSIVLGALVSPILPIAVTLYYYSMAAREQPPSPLPPPPPTRAAPPATPEPRPSPPEPFAEIHCVYCGAENRPDAIFCQSCGKKIVKPL
jgi:MFS family permease